MHMMISRCTRYLGTHVVLLWKLHATMRPTTEDNLEYQRDSVILQVSMQV